MPTTKAQQRASNKYKKENLDQVHFDAPKGFKARVKECAQKKGKSAQRYMIDAIEVEMMKSEKEEK